MASQQVVEKEISSETGSLLKLEDGKESSSRSISNESKSGAADGTCVNMVETGTGNASNMDLDDESSDENREIKRTKMLNDSQLEEKQYIFLKKHFDDLRTRKPLPNYHKMYGESKKSSTIKPLEFKDLLNKCLLDQECRISEKTNEDKELLARQETTVTAKSGVLKKSRIDPLAGHSKKCNVNRLNMYFRAITEYFIARGSHPNLFLLDPNSLVGYKRKVMREIRKIASVRLRYGLQTSLEEWDDNMTDEDFKKWEERNKTREYLHFILNNMLESLIGPNDNPTESEDGSDDDSAQSPSREKAQTDPDKLKYRKLKKFHDALKSQLKYAVKINKRYIQDSVIEGDYTKVQDEVTAMKSLINDYIDLPTDISSEESEREMKRERMKKRMKSKAEKKLT